MSWLVLEGTQKTRDSLLTVLLSLGIQGVAASSAEHALQLVSSSRAVEGAVIDTDTPEIEGLELVKKLRSDPDTRRVSLVVHSAQSGRDFVTGMMQSGVVGYLLKPYDEGSATQKLQSILARLQHHAAERRHIRVRPDPNELLRLHFHLSGHKGLVSGRVLDISMGGVAAELYNAPASYLLQPGKPIRDIGLTIAGAQIVVAGELVNIKESFCAVRFNPLSPHQSRALSRYIYRHLST